MDNRLTAYEDAMGVIYALVQEHKNNSDDELTLQYIGIRLFNLLDISLSLMLEGFYQHSFSLQRDVVEIAFLLDYFAYQPVKVSEWKKATNDDRIKKYSPKMIREVLDLRDGCKNKAREKKYKLFCEYAAHVSYPGNKLVAPKGLGIIGPFYDEKYLKNCFAELLENAFYAVLLFMANSYNIKDPNIVKIHIKFLKNLQEWCKERYKLDTNINFAEIDNLLDKIIE